MDQSNQEHSPAILLSTGAKYWPRFDLQPLKAHYTIGRDESCDIAIEDDSVSRQHCELKWIEDDWFVEDLESMNGTFVNGHRVDRAPLRNDDLIKAGSAIFRFLKRDNIEQAFHGAIYQLAVFDALTELHNRRYFDEFLNREFSRAKRHDRHLALMLFDVDHFSAINETYGTITGDHVLQAIGEKLGQRIRREELLADIHQTALPSCCRIQLWMAQKVRRKYSTYHGNLHFRVGWRKSSHNRKRRHWILSFRNEHNG